MDANVLPVLPPNKVSVADKREVPAMTPKAKLLKWHYCLGHLSFRKIKTMTVRGLIPRRLMIVTHPKCTACTIRVMTKQPWQTKT
eukprot:2800968-Ditylum_brightwellii.AAC.1